MKYPKSNSRAEFTNHQDSTNIYNDSKEKTYIYDTNILSLFEHGDKFPCSKVRI